MVASPAITNRIKHLQHLLNEIVPILRLTVKPMLTWLSLCV